MSTSSQRVVGHATLVQRLLTAGRDGSLSHAILFTGPDGVGKTTAAVALATGLLGAESWPGGIAAHPDFWIEDSDSENISIKRVRPGGDDGPTLQDFLALRPYAGGVRVAVVGRADRLGIDAANNILKSIEEPPPRTHLILAAAHPEKLPQTVVSRCAAYAVAPVPAEAISAWLVATRAVAEERARMAALLAAGRPGRALRLATEEGALDAELDAVDTFLAAGGGGTAAAISAADAVAPGPGAEGRERALITLAAWASFVRDAACYASGAPELAVWRDYRPALERWAQDLRPSRIVEILHRLSVASEAVATYAQPRLAFEALMLDIFGGPDSPPPVEPRPRDPARGRKVSGGAAKGTTRRGRGSGRAAARGAA
jgi:DNA polymerase-3 subunit delta'